MAGPDDTTADEYTDRLTGLASKRWKVLLDTQRPYRWNLKRLEPGRTLDTGCGIGRNLVNLSADSVGVDHNARSVEVVRDLGRIAYTADECRGRQRIREAQKHTENLDSLLLSHVVEHLDAEGGRSLLNDYVPYLRPAGRLIIICPQEKGYVSDATHLMLYDFDGLASLVGAFGFTVTKSYSFLFPRRFGKVFTHNEFVVVAKWGAQ